MSDTMLLGVLRMPMDNPTPLQLAQLTARARQAADRIEADAKEIERLKAEIHPDWDKLEATREALREQSVEIERLKALWYADADPEETEYAEDYYAQIDHRDHVAISKAAEMNPDWDKLEACQQSLREHMAEIERLRKALFDISNRGMAVQREEHRIARAALAATNREGKG